MGFPACALPHSSFTDSMRSTWPRHAGAASTPPKVPALKGQSLSNSSLILPASTVADPCTGFAGAHGASTFVSATQPPQPPKILKNMAQKTDAPLKNAAAWANLGEDDGEDADEDADEAPGEGGGQGPAADEDKEDDLWADFQSRDEQERKRVREPACVRKTAQGLAWHNCSWLHVSPTLWVVGGQGQHSWSDCNRGVLAGSVRSLGSSWAAQILQ